MGDDRFGTVVAAARGWLDENRGRFFLFLHTYEFHHPCRPDPAFRAVLPESYDGPLPDDISIDLLERINVHRLEVTPQDLQPCSRTCTPCSSHVAAPRACEVDPRPARA